VSFALIVLVVARKLTLLGYVLSSSGCHRRCGGASGRKEEEALSETARGRFLIFALCHESRFDDLEMIHVTFQLVIVDKSSHLKTRPGEKPTLWSPILSWAVVWVAIKVSLLSHSTRGTDIGEYTNQFFPPLPPLPPLLDLSPSPSCFLFLSPPPRCPPPPSAPPPSAPEGSPSSEAASPLLTISPSTSSLPANSCRRRATWYAAFSIFARDWAVISCFFHKLGMVVIWSKSDDGKEGQRDCQREGHELISPRG
jgi:hypothetical protein